MSQTVEPLIAAPRSWYDRAQARIAASPTLQRRIAWLAPLLVTLFAGILRIANLQNPHEIAFDETYYVKDAWSQWNLGYPATWPDGADERFAAGETDIYRTSPSYAVHPPLGKFLIAIGMVIFGPESSFGWRISAAVFGTASVLVLYLLAHTLTRSVAFASVAAFLWSIDGLGIEMSRIGLLDVFLMFFIVLAFLFAALDRSSSADRLAAAYARRDPNRRLLGPVLVNRPWIVAAGAAAGAASAVKWSGVWVLAAIGLYLVVTDALERRRLGVWYWPTDAAFRQGPVTFLLLVPVAAVVYLSSWSGWLLSEDGYSRHAADDSPWQGPFAWVPRSLQSLWRYHEQIYASMTKMTSEHTYESPAWQWPALIRPTSMYVGHGDACGDPNGCLAIMYSQPNPILWWTGVLAVIYLLYAFVLHRRWQHALVLIALASTYLPWLAYPERTIFQFYTVVIMPFLILALTFALQAIVRGRTGPAHDFAVSDEQYRRLSGARTVTIFLIVVSAISAFWYPLWTAIEIPRWFYQLHNWMITWI